MWATFQAKSSRIMKSTVCHCLFQHLRESCRCSLWDYFSSVSGKCVHVLRDDLCRDTDADRREERKLWVRCSICEGRENSTVGILSPACLPTSHPAKLPACLHTWQPTYLLIYLPANQLTYLPVYLPACLPTWSYLSRSYIPQVHPTWPVQGPAEHPSLNPPSCCPPLPSPTPSPPTAITSCIASSGFIRYLNDFLRSYVRQFSP